MQQQHQLELLSGEKEQSQGCFQENKQTHEILDYSRTANLSSLKRPNMCLWGICVLRERGHAATAGCRTARLCGEQPTKQEEQGCCSGRDTAVTDAVLMQGCCLAFHSSSEGVLAVPSTRTPQAACCYPAAAKKPKQVAWILHSAAVKHNLTPEISLLHP